MSKLSELAWLRNGSIGRVQFILAQLNSLYMTQKVVFSTEELEETIRTIIP